jgi:hypothetical protein
MCFSRIAQWHPATNRQNELAIAHVIGKLMQLGWIRLRAHTRNLHCRILGRRASGKTAAYPKEPLCLTFVISFAATSPPTVSTIASTKRKFSIALSSSIARTSETPRERASSSSFPRTPAITCAPIFFALWALDCDPRFAGHYRIDGVRAHLFERMGDHEAAIKHYRIAAARTTSIPEQNYFMTQAARLADD